MRTGSHMHTAEHRLCAQIASVALHAAEADHQRYDTYLFHDARNVGSRQVLVQLPDRRILLPTAGARARIRHDVSRPPPSAVGKTNSAPEACNFCAHPTGGEGGCCRPRGERLSDGWRGMTRAWGSGAVDGVGSRRHSAGTHATRGVMTGSGAKPRQCERASLKAQSSKREKMARSNHSPITRSFKYVCVEYPTQTTYP